MKLEQMNNIMVDEHTHKSLAKFIKKNATFIKNYIYTMIWQLIVTGKKKERERRMQNDWITTPPTRAKSFCGYNL